MKNKYGIGFLLFLILIVFAQLTLFIQFSSMFFQLKGLPVPDSHTFRFL